jgi:hypothetical protein
MCGMWLGTWNDDNLPRKCSLWKLCVKGRGGDESGQTRLLTFGKILDRRMRELEPGSFIKFVVLDVS